MLCRRIDVNFEQFCHKWSNQEMVLPNNVKNIIDRRGKDNKSYKKPFTKNENKTFKILGTMR